MVIKCYYTTGAVEQKHWLPYLTIPLLEQDWVFFCWGDDLVDKMLAMKAEKAKCVFPEHIQSRQW